MSENETAAPIQPKHSIGSDGNEELVTSYKILNDLDETVVVKWHPENAPAQDSAQGPIAPGVVWNTEGWKTWGGYSWYGIYRTDGTLICNFTPRDEAVVLLDGTPRDYCFRDTD